MATKLLGRRRRRSGKVNCARHFHLSFLWFRVGRARNSTCIYLDNNGSLRVLSGTPIIGDSRSIKEGFRRRERRTDESMVGHRFLSISSLAQILSPSPRTMQLFLSFIRRSFRIPWISEPEQFGPLPLRNSRRPFQGPV